MKILPNSPEQQDRKRPDIEEIDRLFRIVYYSLICGFVLVYVQICILFFLPKYRDLASPSFIISYPIFGVVTLWISQQLKKKIK